MLLQTFSNNSLTLSGHRVLETGVGTERVRSASYHARAAQVSQGIIGAWYHCP